jgi:para-nitrobenzyl esterase
MMDFFKKTRLDEMRALSFEELLQMSKDYSTETNKRIFWGPVVDGYLLNETFSDAAAHNKIADIPYMFGYTANDIFDMTKAIKDFCALRAEKSSKPVFAYLFARRLPGDSSGAFHSSDLWYVFHSYSHSWRPFTAGDKALSSQIVTYWTNFAKFGNPNGTEKAVWTSYTAKVPKFMVFDIKGDEASCTMTDIPEYKGNSFSRVRQR